MGKKGFGRRKNKLFGLPLPLLAAGCCLVMLVGFLFLQYFSLLRTIRAKRDGAGDSLGHSTGLGPGKGDSSQHGKGDSGQHGKGDDPFRPSAQHQCTASQAAHQVSEFKDIGRDVWYWGCPKEIWWQLVHEFSPSAAGKVFLDIGMNKGYTAGTWYGLWNPDLQLNVKTLFQAIKAVPPNDKQDCGACADCMDHVLPLTPHHNEEVIRVHGVDASPVAIAKHNRLVLEHFPQVTGKWTSVLSAASDEVGTIQFAKMDTLSEVAAVNANTEMVTVPMVTVPKLLNDLGIEEVFVLKIDTEGNDPKVLLGAKDLINEHRATLVYFEYHKLGLWKAEHSLEWFANDFFEPRGYACYFLGHVCAMRLTGCWDKIFEYRDWSNIMCISTRDAMPLVRKFDEHSYFQNDKCTKRAVDEKV